MRRRPLRTILLDLSLLRSHQDQGQPEGGGGETKYEGLSCREILGWGGFGFLFLGENCGGLAWSKDRVDLLGFFRMGNLELEVLY